MKVRPRTAAIVVLSCLAAACLGVWLWLPWDPFEKDAGPLDEWVPAGVDAVVRLDAGGLRRAGIVRALWDCESVARLRERSGIDDALGRIRDADAALATLPGAGGDPPTVAADFLGREVLVAVRDDDVLVLARISGRAKAIDLLRRASEERRDAWGIEYDGESRSYTVTEGDAIGVRFARRRDVLIVSNSDDLFDESLALCDGTGASIVADPEYAAARPPAPDGATISAWATGAFAARIVGERQLAADLFDGAFEHAVRIDVDANARDAVKATARFAGRASSLFDVSEVAATAARLGRDAFASGALPLTAQEVVAALFDSQPPARRKLVDDLLAENGSSAKDVVADVARHLADGVGFAVTRLPETDSLRLDDVEGDVRIPVPATIAVFRLADASADALVADLRRHAEALFGRGAKLTEETLPGGGRLFRVAGTAPFGPEWALVRPALAVVGRDVVFSSNYEQLVAALGAPASADYDANDAWLEIDAAGLKRRLLDLRWDAADRATSHDWAAERDEIRHVQQISPDASTPAERRRSEDAEIAKRIRERREVEFPAALRRYAQSVAWLDVFTRADCRLVKDGAGLRIDATIGVRVP
jgi:hypothetical protein